MDTRIIEACLTQLKARDKERGTDTYTMYGNVYIEFLNGQTLQLHDDEIKHQACEHIASLQNLILTS